MHARSFAGRWARLFLVSSLGAWGLVPLAHAAPPVADSVPRVVPYEGQLALDGEAVHGDVAMRFSVHDTTAPDGAALWSVAHDQSCTNAAQTHCKIAVRAGQFSVLLGQHDQGGTTLAGVIATSRDVCLRIDVQESGGSWVPLGGCQRFAAAPFALWSAGGANPTITGNLTVNGDVSATVVSATTVSATNVNTTNVTATNTSTGALTASGAVSGASVTASGRVQGGSLQITGASSLATTEIASAVVESLNGRLLTGQFGQVEFMDCPNLISIPSGPSICQIQPLMAVEEGFCAVGQVGAGTTCAVFPHNGVWVMNAVATSGYACSATCVRW